MKIDSATTPDEFIDELRFNWDYSVYDARAELARRSELAAKYERLTRALHALANRWERGVVVSSSCLHSYDHGGPVTHYNADYDDSAPDSIADAIIAAAEEVK